MRRTCFKSGTYIIHSVFVCMKELLRNLYDFIMQYNINNNITKMHPINPNSSPIIANIKSFCGSGM